MYRTTSSIKSIQEELPNEISALRNGSLQWVCDDRIKDDLGRFFDRIEAEFGQTYSDYLHKQAQIDDKLLL
jgi:hypothetical protein